MFSLRLPADHRTNPLTRALAHTRPQWDLTVSNPSAAGFTHDPALLRSLASPATLEYQPEPQGLASARQALSHHLANHQHTRVGAEDLYLTPSTSDAYSYLFKLLCNPGDNVLVPRPSYPLLEHLAALEGLEIRPYPIRYDGRYYIDIPSLLALRDARTRAVITVHPNNPTGSHVHPEALAGLAACDLPIISDEVFASFRLAHIPQTPPSLLHYSLPQPVFALQGLSKAAALPQLKLAWIAVGGSPTQRQAIRERLGFVADCYLSTGYPVQHALPELLHHIQPMHRRICERLEQNLQTLQRSLAAPCALTARHVEGGWYATVQVPRVYTEEEWALQLLTKSRVLVHPGYYYDFEEDGLLVLSLLPPARIFSEGVEQMRRAVESHLS